jgi:cytochrome P450
MESTTAALSPTSRGRYNFPPGLEENLVWYALRQRRWVDPIKLFKHLVARYGDISHYKLLNNHVIFINNPEYLREVFVVQHSNFIKERTQQRSKLLLGEGMITADGATHRRQRQVAQPAFHRQRIPIYAEEIVRRATGLSDAWQPSQRDIYTDMMELTLGIIGKTLFNTDLRAEVGELNHAMGDIMDVYRPLVLLPGVRAPLKIPFTPLRKFISARERLDRTAYRMIEHHRRGVHGDDDLLSTMLAAKEQAGWSDEELRDQVVTVFLAGYETVAIGLTWTWYLLAQHTDVERRLHAEIDTVLKGRLPTYDDIPKLRYAEMVISESFRLYPPAWAMGRQAVEDFTLGPFHLPAGTTLLAAQFVTHRDARFFVDPLRFDPERFSPEAKAARTRFSYFPFGMGPRQCIGESFAMMETILVLATLAQRWAHVARFPTIGRAAIPLHVANQRRHEDDPVATLVSLRIRSRPKETRPRTREELLS